MRRARRELRGIRDILRKVGEWFLIPLCHRSFWFKGKKKNTQKLGLDVIQTRQINLVYASDFYAKPFDLIIPTSAYTYWVNCKKKKKKSEYTAENRADKVWRGSRWMNSHILEPRHSWMKYRQRVKRGQFTACAVWNSKFRCGSGFAILQWH